MRASGRLMIGSDPSIPRLSPIGAAAGTNGVAASRRKVNSALRLGRLDEPSPVFCGSPVWSMKPSITRKKVRPS